MNKRNMTLGGLVIGLIALSGCPANDSEKVVEPAYTIYSINKVFVPPECKQVINGGLTQSTRRQTIEYIMGKDANGNIKMWYHLLGSRNWNIQVYISAPDAKLESTITPINSSQNVEANK